MTDNSGSGGGIWVYQPSNRLENLREAWLTDFNMVNMSFSGNFFSHLCEGDYRPEQISIVLNNIKEKSRDLPQDGSCHDIATAYAKLDRFVKSLNDARNRKIYEDEFLFDEVSGFLSECAEYGPGMRYVLADSCMETRDALMGEVLRSRKYYGDGEFYKALIGLVDNCKNCPYKVRDSPEGSR